jgi:hypothetical protein
MTQSLSAEPQLTPVGRRPQGPWLVIDRDLFGEKLNARACPVRHRLTEHPLFELPRLLELAKWLPEKYVRINSGAVPVDATPEQIPGTGLSVEESFRRIEAGRREFDLLADEAFYKLQLAPRSRPLVRVRAARPSAVEGVRRTVKGCLASLRALRRRASL